MKTEQKHILLGLLPEQLSVIALEAGLPAFAGKQIAHWIYQKGVGDIAEMTNLSKIGRESLAEEYEVGLMEPLKRQCSVDGTVKYLFPTHGGDGVYPGRGPRHAVRELSGRLQDELPLLYDRASGLPGQSKRGRHTESDLFAA